MVFIDQPACVGFSYSKDLRDCNTSDTVAASVNVQAIKKFLFSVMPHYRNRQFWYGFKHFALKYKVYWRILCWVLCSNALCSRC